jgi:hypothetical protein
MARQEVFLGTAPNSSDGTPLRSAFAMLNSNFREAYGGLMPVPKLANRWYAPQPFSVKATGAAVAADILRLHGMLLNERCTIDQVQARVTTPIASSQFEIAIYASDPVSGLPTGAPLSSVTGLSSAAAALVVGTLASPVTLDPGLYYIGITASAAPVFVAFSAGISFLSSLIGFTNGASVNGSAAGVSVQWLGYTATYGSLPNVTSVSPSFNVTGAFAAVDFRVSAVG